MASTYIKNFRLPDEEGAGFVTMNIVGEDDVHSLDVERMRDLISEDVANLPKPKQVQPNEVHLASGRMHAKRTAKNEVTVSKP